MRSWISRGLLAVFVVTGVGCEGEDVDGARPMLAGPARSTTFVADQIGGGGSQMTPEQGAQIICAKYEACLGDIADLGMQQCVNSMAGSLDLVIDIAAFVACFNGLSCEELVDEGIGDKLLQCLDIDESSAECTGTGARYCNNQGTCKEIDCQTLCSVIEGQIQGDVPEVWGGCCECGWQRPGDPPMSDQNLPDQPSD